MRNNVAVADRRALEQISPTAEDAATRAQEILDRHCLFFVNINPEMRVKVAAGPAKPELVEQGWRLFLVKVQNEAGATAVLHATSPHAQRLFNAPTADVPARWLELQMADAQPRRAALSGLELEYRIIQLYSRDAGQREAKFSFDVGQGTQDIDFRNETDLLFRCAPAHPVTLRVRDENDRPTTAGFVVRDQQQHVYPSQAKRLAPDLAFHPQVYRADGENLRLPEGSYVLRDTPDGNSVFFGNEFNRVILGEIPIGAPLIHPTGNLFPLSLWPRHRGRLGRPRRVLRATQQLSRAALRRGS